MKNGKDDVTQTQGATKKVSMHELTKQLENGELSPGTLKKKVL